MRISNINTRETNEHYDPLRCNNGGGYSQPVITVDFDDGVSVMIEDTSCGDFGSRIRAAICINGEEVYTAAWGSMLGEWEWGSDIPDSPRLVMVESATGYHIMTAEEAECSTEEEYEEEYYDADHNHIDDNRYGVIYGNRGEFPHIEKYGRRIDAVRIALECFHSGYDFIRIDAL